MKNGLRFALYAALLALPLASCECDTPPISSSPAEIAVNPEQLSWGDVCQESGTDRTFTITNRGRSTLNAELAIEGSAADFFHLDKDVLAIDTAGGSAEVRVTFHPTGEDLRGNSYTAEVVITSNGSDEPVRVRLSGRVADVDPTPILSFGCSPDLPLCTEAAGGACCFTTCDDPSSPACAARKLQAKTLDFGSSIIDEDTAVVTARISNLGCGPLEVNEVRLERLFIDTCDPFATEGGGDPVDQVRVKDFAPFVVEGSVDPLAPKTHDISFEFKPVQQVCDVSRKFVLVTNDPNAAPDEPGTSGTGPAAGTLSGRSSRSMLEISPPGNFRAVPYDEHKEIEFTIRNSNTDQEITIQNLEIGGRDAGRFEIVSSTKCGEPQGTNPTNILMARSTGTGASCEDRFQVTIRYTPGEAGGRHEARLNLHHQFGTTGTSLTGNSLPVLALYPDRVTFGAPEPASGQPRVCSEDGKTCVSGACTETCTNDDHCMSGKCLDNICSDTGTICVQACKGASRSVQMCNEGIARLTLDKLEVFGDQDSLSPAPRDTYEDDNGPLIFRLNGDCNGEVLEPGQCCTETVHYQDSRVGGATMAVIRVTSDDPVWSDGAWVDLASNSTAAGRIPQAEIAALGTTNPPVRSWIRFDGTGSSVGLGELQDFIWKFKTTRGVSQIPDHTIDNANPRASCPSIYNGGECFRLSENGRVLEFWTNDAPALEYEISLQVTSNLCNPNEKSAVFRRTVVTSDPSH